MKKKIVISVDHDVLVDFDNAIEKRMIPRSRYLNKLMKEEIKKLENKNYDVSRNDK
ncbi:MAG: hypothetical protein K8R11_11155 [Methanococcoides sp.]|nr:hypothetical protein [Methanococcoides sp.]